MLLPSRKEIRRRGIYILPSLFTLGNLFCGFYALIEASKGRFGSDDAAIHFERAAFFIAISMVLDGLDGKIARLAHATSAMGVQLDSLADVVAFGVAPALLVYAWGFESLGRVGMAVALLFTGCGALRLARFNVQAVAYPDNRYFVGLPIPGAALGIAAMIYSYPKPIEDGAIAGVIAAWTATLALLMVSTLRYRSMKQVDIFQRQPARALVWVLLIIVLLFSFTEVALVAAALIYTMHGLVWKGISMLRPRPPEAPGSPAASGGEGGVD